jgi:leucyl aminopeptidase
MQFDIWAKDITASGTDCIAIGVHEDGTLSATASQVNKHAGGRIAKALQQGDFAAKLGDTWLLTEVPGVHASRVLLVGLGPRGELTRKSWRRATAAAISAACRTKAKSLALGVPRPASKALDDTMFGRVTAELTGQALYRVNDLKSAKKPAPPALERVFAGPAQGPAAQKIKRGLAEGEALVAGSLVMRNLANLPGNVCTPTYLGKQAEAIAEKYKSLSVNVLGLEEIKKEKMGCFLAVAQGSEQPPRFIVLQHKHPKAKRAPIVLVGKGITFDTGGISLKDPPAMDEMKFDMSGAAAVLAAMTTVAELNLPLNVVCLVATCENMPSGKAIKPGDIVTSASGQTVEILNTDAEGRLILSDALHYARRFEPEAVVDVATLTGAIVVALGAHHTGVFSNDDKLAHELVDCGLRADDRAWHMPLADEYGDQLRSNFADMANVAGRDGGSCTAAAFLGKFTQGLTWAHLDIAGTAYMSGANKGSTGRPMGLLTEFLIRRAAR